MPEEIVIPEAKGLTTVRLHMLVEDDAPNQDGWGVYTSNQFRGEWGTFLLHLSHLERSRWITVDLPLVYSDNSGMGLRLDFYKDLAVVPVQESPEQFDILRKLYWNQQASSPEAFRFISELKGVWFHKVEFLNHPPEIVREALNDPMYSGLTLAMWVFVAAAILWLFILVQAKSKLVYLIAGVLLMMPLILMSFLMLVDSEPLQSLHAALRLSTEEDIRTLWEDVHSLSEKANQNCVKKALDSLNMLNDYMKEDLNESILENLRVSARIIRNEAEQNFLDMPLLLDKIYPLYCKTLMEWADAGRDLHKSLRVELESCKNQTESLKELQIRAKTDPPLTVLNRLAHYARASHPIALVLSDLEQNLGFSMELTGEQFQFSRQYVGTGASITKLKPLWLSTQNQLCQYAMAQGQAFSACNSWNAIKEMRLLLGQDNSNVKSLDTMMQNPERSLQVGESDESIHRTQEVWAIPETNWGKVLAHVKYSRNLFIPELISLLEKKFPQLEYYLMPPPGHIPWPYEIINQGQFHKIAAQQIQNNRPLMVHSNESGKSYLYLAKTLDSWKPYTLVVRMETTAVWRWVNAVAFGIPLVIGLLILCSLILCYVLTQRTATPLQEILQACERIRLQDLSREVKVLSRDEISIVVGLLNQVLNGLRQTALMQKFLNSLVKKSDFSDQEITKRRLAAIIFIGFRDPSGQFLQWSDSRLIEFHHQFLTLSQSILLQFGWEVDKFTNHDCLGIHPWPLKLEEMESFCRTLKIRLNELQEQYPQIHTGIGIAYGEVVVGRVGVQSRMDYTCIGDTVNLAARLCAKAQGLKTRIMTHQELVIACGIKTFDLVGDLEIRGKKSRVRVAQL